MIEGDCGGDDGTLDGHVIEGDWESVQTFARTRSNWRFTDFPFYVCFAAALIAVTELPRIIADLESDRPSNASLVLPKIIGALRS